MAMNKRAPQRTKAPAEQPLHTRRGVVITVSLLTMLLAALGAWLAISAVPHLTKSLPVEKVVFVSTTNARLTEVDDEALKRVADALQTRGASVLQIDLIGLKSSVMQIPWVREASIRRQFPSSLVIAVEEHVPVALWNEAAEPQSATNMVNSYGEVFSAVIADERKSTLPKLTGPEGTSADVLSKFMSVETSLRTIARAPTQLTLTGRRAWQLTLDDGSALEFGRADFDQRLQRFVRAYPDTPALQVAGAVVDLRYQTGFTVRGLAVEKSQADGAAKKRSATSNTPNTGRENI
jgi:cell division protein FtsQ